MELWHQKHELSSRLQFFLCTSADASSITRALCGPWPQRGVEFVAREVLRALQQKMWPIAARNPTWARRTTGWCTPQTRGWSVGAGWKLLRRGLGTTNFVAGRTRRHTVPWRSRGVSLFMTSAHRRSVVSVCARRPKEIWETGSTTCLWRWRRRIAITLISSTEALWPGTPRSRVWPSSPETAASGGPECSGCPRDGDDWTSHWTLRLAWPLPFSERVKRFVWSPPTVSAVWSHRQHLEFVSQFSMGLCAIAPIVCMLVQECLYEDVIAHGGAVMTCCHEG